MTPQQIKANAPEGATAYMEQRGDIVYLKPHPDFAWYRWTGSAWEHYCWYQEIKPL